MEQLPENDPEQGSRAAAIPLSLGRMLSEARERLGLSVQDVAAQTKFAPRQVEALEADDFKHLPEMAFLRGFVRSYAKILNMDAQTLLAALPQTKATVAELIPASVDVPFPVAQPVQRQNLILLGAALLLAVIVLGFAVWHFTTPPKQSEVAKIETPVPLPSEMQVIPAPPAPKQSMTIPATAAETKPRSSVAAAQSSVRAAKTPPAPKQSMTIPATAAETKPRSSVAVEQSSVGAVKTPAAQAVPKTESTDSAAHHNAPAQTTTLRLVFDEESWTEISDKDGKILSSKVNPRGSELNLEGPMPLSLVIGHATTTHLYQDGEEVDLAPYINSSSEVARLILE